MDYLGDVYGMNDAGELLYGALLAPSTSGTPVDNSNNEILAIHRLGLGSTIVAREGDPVPGLPGVSYAGIPGDSISNSLRAVNRSLLQTGEVLFTAWLTSTNNPPLDGQWLLRWSNGVVELVLQTGTPAPGTNGNFATLPDGLHNGAGQVALKGRWSLPNFQSEEAIWLGTPGNLQPLVTEGQLLPGTGGGIVGALTEPSSQGVLPSAPAFYLTEAGQVVFSCVIEGGDSPGRSLWTGGLNQPLRPVVLPGDQIQFPNGIVRTVQEYGSGMPPGGWDGYWDRMDINAGSLLALRVQFTDGSSAIMTASLPIPLVSYCFGEGNGPGTCGDCPCSNDAAAGTLGGCLNSAGRSSRLIGSGSPELADDTLRFEVSGASSNSFALLISADNRLPAMGPCPVGSGLLAFDGKRWTGGAFLRHGARATDTNGDIGSSNAGWGGGDAPAGGLIASSGFVLGQTRNFQAFYRDDPGLTCQTGQNSTNAVAVTFY